MVLSRLSLALSNVGDDGTMGTLTTVSGVQLAGENDMAATVRVPTIPPEIEARRDEIEALCRRFGVVRLDLFGSSTIGTFDPETSDYDFIVDLGRSSPGIATRFFDFEEALRDLLGRQVDLNTEPTGRNRFYMAGVRESRVMLYEARDGQAA